MKLARALSEVEAKKVQTIVLLGGVFTTLTIWTKLEDPINLPKMFVLVLFASITLGLVMPALLSAHKLSSKEQKISLGLFSLLKALLFKILSNYLYHLVLNWALAAGLYQDIQFIFKLRPLY
jgi:hypothetical protein